MFKYLEVFQYDNGSEFRNKVTKLLENHNFHIQRATTKNKKIHASFVEAFNEVLAKLLFKPIDAQELQHPEKIYTIWVKMLNKTVNKLNNIVSSMIGVKPKDEIKLHTVPLAKEYLGETVLPEDGL